MDARPQRPRALRVHDENMPPPGVTGVAAVPVKTLHKRMYSTSALNAVQADAVKAASKKVLGEVNANSKLVKQVKDDLEVGRESPGKIKVAMQEPVKPTAAFARPATRPLAPKNASATIAPTTTSVAAPAPAKPQVTEGVIRADAEAEPMKRVAPKKSTKVLRDAELKVDANKRAPNASPRQTSALTGQVGQLTAFPQCLTGGVSLTGPAVQHQEVRRTASVPLRDGPAPRNVKSNPSLVQAHLPPGFSSGQEYINYQHANAVQYQAPVGIYAVEGPAQYLQQSVHQSMDHLFDALEEAECSYDDGYTTARSFGLRAESTGGITTILMPKYTDKVQRELAAAKAVVEATRSPDDIEDEQWDTSMVAEYSDEIFQYMRDLETRMAPNPRYMEQQTEIQWSMRAVLMDWVIQVHQRFNLLPETLFLTANYIDRFLSCKIVSLGKLQLVGATAIFIAAKYEEIQCPTISEIIYMVDGGYSADELLKAERFMLSMLQFELGWPGPMSFLRRISKADDYDLETRTLAKYFLEITILDERFVGCTPSFLAAGAHCIARLMLGKGDWSPAHVFYSNYTYGQLRQLLVAIVECCEDPQKHHSAVFEKYLDKRYKRASTYVATRMQEGFQLPGLAHCSSIGMLDGVNSRLW